MTEHQIKHLEFIQNVIKRLNSNSFQIKGWMITIASAFLALYANSKDIRYVLVATVPTIIFWYVDSLYLQRERRFRGLYEDVIKPDNDIPEFSMDISKYTKGVYKHWNCIWSRTIWPLYCLTIVFLIVGCLLIKYWNIIRALILN